MARLYTAIGLMSGTSMDGIDVSLIKTDGQKVFDLQNMPNRFYAYSDADRRLISKTLKIAPQTKNLGWHQQIEKCRSLITNTHIKAVNSFLKCQRISPKNIDVIGFHGQTVLHQPDRGITLQLGDGARLAKDTGIDVVYDFRSHDVAQGGQGAPLVPVFHQALVSGNPGLEGSSVVVNIGGVANLSFIPPGGNGLLAFDTGPGNALMDDWVCLHTDKTMDKNGEIARGGQVHLSCLEAYLSHPFFSQQGAKSLDRNDFPLETLKNYGLNLEDALATLCEFTARSIARSSELLPQQAANWIITGGGTRNTFLMERLAQLLEAKVSRAEDYGWSSDFMEAQAFAFLAVRHILSLPQTFPGTTGSKSPLTGGVLVNCPRA